MYEDGRFARHPWFRYFALNTEMHWRALQAGRIGRIYVCQHPHDAQLSVEELRGMVGHINIMCKRFYVTGHFLITT